MESRQEFGDRFTTYLAMHDGVGGCWTAAAVA